MKLKFIFKIEPKAIQSFRFAKIGNFVKKYQPRLNAEWKNWIKLQAQTQLPPEFSLIVDPIAITKLHFIFKPLESFPKYKLKQIENGDICYKTTKPDIDNLQKGIIDSLIGIVFLDDKQIVAMDNVKKYYGIESRIELEIEQLNKEKEKMKKQDFQYIGETLDLWPAEYRDKCMEDYINVFFWRFEHSYSDKHIRAEIWYTENHSGVFFKVVSNDIPGSRIEWFKKERVELKERIKPLDVKNLDPNDILRFEEEGFFVIRSNLKIYWKASLAYRDAQIFMAAILKAGKEGYNK